MREKYNGYKSTFGQTPEPPQRGNGKGFLWLYLICGILATGCFGVVGQSAYSKYHAPQVAAAQQLAASQAAALQRLMTEFPSYQKGVKSNMALANAYDVAGAGIEGFTGTYTDSGDINGYPYYQYNGNHYLFWAITDFPSPRWVLNTSLTEDTGGIVEYEGGGNPADPTDGTWSVGMAGEAPAPTLTAVGVDNAPPTYAPSTPAYVPTTGDYIFVPITEETLPLLPLATTTVTGFTVKRNGVVQVITKAATSNATHGFILPNASEGYQDVYVSTGAGFNAGQTYTGIKNGKVAFYDSSTDYYYLGPDINVANAIYKATSSGNDPSGVSSVLYWNLIVGSGSVNATATYTGVFLFIDKTIRKGDGVTFEYDKSSGNVHDSYAKEMPDVTDTQVSNLSEIAPYRPVIFTGTGLANLQDGDQLIQPAPVPVQVLTDGATITWNVGNNAIEKAVVTLGQDRVLDVVGATNGQQGILIVKQNGSGGWTLALPSGSVVVDDGSGAVVLTTDGGAIDILAFLYDGTNYYWTKGVNFT